MLRIDIDTVWIRDTLKREEDYLSLYVVDNEGRVVLSSKEYIYEDNDAYNFINFDDLPFDKEELF